MGLLCIIIIAYIYKIKPLLIFSTILFISLVCFMCFMATRERYTQPELRDILTKVIEKFNQHDIKYWVDYGSLLGIIRENDIIKHDYDTDICIFPDNPDIEQKLIKIVKELGHPYYLEYNPWSVDTFRIRKRAGMYMFDPYTDIYGTRKESNMFIDATGKIPTELIGKTQKISWNGVSVTVPEKIHETLVWRYGENYMTPMIFKGSEN